jgi:hypothetical protein
VEVRFADGTRSDGQEWCVVKVGRSDIGNLRQRIYELVRSFARSVLANRLKVPVGDADMDDERYIEYLRQHHGFEASDLMAVFKFDIGLERIGKARDYSARRLAFH